MLERQEPLQVYMDQLTKKKKFKGSLILENQPKQITQLNNNIYSIYQI